MEIPKKLYRGKEFRKILLEKQIEFCYSSKGMKFTLGQRTATVHLKTALRPNAEITKDIVETINKYL